MSAHIAFDQSAAKPRQHDAGVLEEQIARTRAGITQLQNRRDRRLSPPLSEETESVSPTPCKT
jgi:hypothetical protein